MPDLWASETNRESSIWHRSLMWPVSSLVTSWWHWSPYIIEWAAFCSYWNDIDSRYRFTFSKSNASAKSIIHGLIECFIHHYDIPQSLAPHQRIHFTEIEGWQWALLMEFTGLTMFLTILKQLLDQIVEWPFEDSVTVLGRWQYLAGWNKGPPKAVMLWTGIQRCCFSDNQDLWSWS